MDDISSFFLMIRRPPRSTQSRSSAASDVYKRQVIYAPFQTEFSEAGNAKGNSIENGLNMFLFQGQQAFNIWHNVEPEINKELIEFLKN